MQLLTPLVTAYRRWAHYGRLYSELSHLSDRELADIGIQRSEIRDIALQSARKLQAQPAPDRKTFATRIATAN